MVSYVAFVLFLFVPNLSFLWYPKRTVLPDCSISGVSSLMFEPAHDKTNKITCAPSEDSDQPGLLPSLIRVFAVRSMGSEAPKLSSCGQRGLIRLGGCPG